VSRSAPLVWSQPSARHIASALALQDEGPRLCTRFAIAAGYSDPSGIAFHSERFTVNQLVIKAPIRLKAQAITGGFRTEFLPLVQFPEFIHEKLGPGARWLASLEILWEACHRYRSDFTRNVFSCIEARCRRIIGTRTTVSRCWRQGARKADQD
jgi:hypothetical protein